VIIVEKIIIYAGSFNPVTKGHLLTIKAAIEKVNADKGMFFITHNDYLTRKMIFRVKSNFILSEDIRKEMIDSLSKEDDKVSFGGREVGCGTPSTVKTINKVMRSNKKAEIYVLLGADKLRKLPEWNEIDTVIDKIKLIVAVRSGFNIDEIIDNDEWLTKHKDKLIVVNPDPEAFKISSTEIRRRFFAGEDYQDLMNDGPYEVLKRFNPSDFPEQTDEDIIYYELKYNSFYSTEGACKLVYESNAKIFKNWDESLLGNKENKLKNTKLYKDEFITNYKYDYNTVTDCVNKDCADVAIELIKEGYNPAILNLASKYSPGGGYHDGYNTQEESLCQMSTLSQSLYQYGSLEYGHIKDADLPNYPDGYPLGTNFGGIYSQDVTFFRNPRKLNFSLRDEVFSCSIITVASLSNRKKKQKDWVNEEAIYFNPDGTMKPEGIEIQKNKIRTIYRIALENGHDSIVLGAFGCGVFNLLPSEVSQLFYDVLNEEEFKNKFKKIVFAILERKGKNGNKLGINGKFKPFYDLFANK
jgi:nicotinate (nicotinamide) nucleotide adenylyltransferase